MQKKVSRSGGRFVIRETADSQPDGIRVSQSVKFRLEEH